MFIAREQELEVLETLYAKDGFQMAVVYGRRRIGKTSLLTEFIKNKDSIYLPAEEINDALNLKKFSRILGEKLGLSPFPSYENWNDFFDAIISSFSNKRLVLVIDEYPYAANANKSLNSILQHIIDHTFKNSRIFLILCGSSVSFMENAVLGEKSPLFGRRTGQLKVGPLDYYDAAKFYPDVSYEDKIRYYSTIGGSPYYLSLIDTKLSFEENIKALYFNMGGYLFNEGTFLIKQEFREVTNYNAVLQAIAAGHVTLGEIAQYTKQETSLISKYLLVLQELNLVDRLIPFDANPLRSKTSQYRIIENFLSFWYLYVFAIRSEIERNSSDVYFDYTIENLNSFIGTRYEEICRQYLRRLNKNKELPFIAKSFGLWWGKDKTGAPQEIDIVVQSIDSKSLILGEYKWCNTIKPTKIEQTLNDRAALFTNYEKYLWIFTKGKYHSSSNIKYISAKEMFD